MNDHPVAAADLSWIRGTNRLVGGERDCVAGEPLRITDGESTCRIPDPAGGVATVAVIELSLQGALLATKIQLEANAYVDATLALRGLAPRQLFAHVVSADQEGLRLRWLHFDPGEEAKLKSLIESYSKQVSAGGAKAPSATSGTRRVVKPKGDAPPAETPGAPGAPGASGTRRLVRPSSTAITPFSDAPPAVPSSPPADPGGSSRVGTRRVLRPSQQALTPFADAVPAAETRQDIGEESRTSHVVIETTDRFEKLVDVNVRAPAAEAQQAGSGGHPIGTPSGGQPITATPSGGHPTAPGEGSGGHPVEPFGDDSGAHQVAGGKTSFINKDGRMDIGASIRSRAKTVRASELAARHDKVRVLNMGTIKVLIQEAVEEAAVHLTRALGEAERKRLMEEAEEGFQERLKAFTAEKLSADVRAKQLSDQLQTAQKLLEEERKRSVTADQFTVSERGLEEIDVRVKKTLELALAMGGVTPEIENQLRELIARVLDSEREKIREKELAAQNAKIALLEKKIGRLSSNLEDAERQRDDAREYANAMEAAGGNVGPVINKYKVGVRREDPNRERKLALMKELMDQNRELRRQLGIELNKVEPKPAAPPEPEPPPKPVVEEEPAAEQPVEAVTPEVDPDNEPWDGKPAEPEVNPDDEVWTGAPPAAAGSGTDEVDEKGVKRIKAFKDIEPPPLQRK
jgi:hypothetical protein